MFRDRYHPKVKKDLKKIDKIVQKDIKEIHIPAILHNSYIGQQLTGNLAGIYSYHFKKGRTDYRICYIVNEQESTVYVLMIGTRENFYRDLIRRL
ncbi:MAG: type II toxin-antitoxin system RelE/ParE family toxin [Candidatus Desulfofervidaceae bacterium]|nr:type II toxin-antitoxin system RelE/ParE family toxin [Candidatus Desulfofervidaceae bacterium]